MISTYKQWSVGAGAVFRHFMPPIAASYPVIHYCDGKTFKDMRSRLLSDTGCKLKGYPEDSCMEYIHGSKGGAILIRVDQLPDGVGFEHFTHFLWHELGHFYSINADTHDLERFDDPDAPPSEANVKEKQRGYWFWQEFIAEAIANHISYKYRSTDPESVGKGDAPSPYYHPETIEWNVNAWSPLLERIQGLIDDLYIGRTIDEYILAHYFATLLKDDLIVLFVKAAEDGKLIRFGKTHPAAPGEIDASCIDEAYGPIQPILLEMKLWLSKRISGDKFWEMDEEGIEYLGKLIYQMDALLTEIPVE